MRKEARNFPMRPATSIVRVHKRSSAAITMHYAQRVGDKRLNLENRLVDGLSPVLTWYSNWVIGQ